MKAIGRVRAILWDIFNIDSRDEEKDFLRLAVAVFVSAVVFYSIGWVAHE